VNLVPLNFKTFPVVAPVVSISTPVTNNFLLTTVLPVLFTYNAVDLVDELPSPTIKTASFVISLYLPTTTWELPLAYVPKPNAIESFPDALLSLEAANELSPLAIALYIDSRWIPPTEVSLYMNGLWPETVTLIIVEPVPPINYAGISTNANSSSPPERDGINGFVDATPCLMVGVLAEVI